MNSSPNAWGPRSRLRPRALRLPLAGGYFFLGVGFTYPQVVPGLLVGGNGSSVTTVACRSPIPPRGPISRTIPLLGTVEPGLWVFAILSPPIRMDLRALLRESLV